MDGGSGFKGEVARVTVSAHPRPSHGSDRDGGVQPDLLMTGRFVDEEFFERDRKAFIAKGYTAGKRAAIVVWNITEHEHRFMPKLLKMRRFIEGATVTGPFRPGDMLPAHSVGVLVYE